MEEEFTKHNFLTAFKRGWTMVLVLLMYFIGYVIASTPSSQGGINISFANFFGLILILIALLLNVKQIIVSYKDSSNLKYLNFIPKVFVLFLGIFILIISINFML
ncbi:MAG: hypothetical protein ACMXYB_04180 [Candidatus Woesearchaeota archaeon]